MPDDAFSAPQRSAAAGPLVDAYELFIDGAWHPPAAGRFDDACPSTGEVLASVPDASPAQMGQAVAAARQAFDDGRWSEREPEFRAGCLRQLGEALFAARDDFVALSRVEWGCTANEEGLQIDAPAFMALHGADLALAPAEEEVAPLGASGKVLVRHEPAGVVSVLTPWNFPHTLNVMKLAPALAAGNTVVLKPSPLAPLSALAVARLIEEKTDIPPGVVNVVTASSLEASQALVTDPKVDMVSFTGATATGRTIMSMAAETLKRVLLELGGKSATVLLHPADLDDVLPRLLFEGCTLHAGQACILRSRLLVPRAAHDGIVERLAALADAVAVGDPLLPGVEMGPLISDVQHHKVTDLVDEAVAHGAQLAAGGGRPQGLDRGHFFAPTVLGGVDPRSAIAQTEVFGPVLSVIPYEHVDEAVDIANDSMYGLTGSVIGADVEQATVVARRLRTGQVEVNGSTLGGAPFGGFKQSGIGREGGLAGLRQYTETKAIGLPVS